MKLCKCGKFIDECRHGQHLKGVIPWNKGKKGSQVSWNKGNIGFNKGHIGYNKGKPWTEEQKEKLKGRVPWNKDKKGLQVAWNKDKKLSEDHVQSLKETWKIPSQKRLDGIKRQAEKIKGKPSWNKGISPSEESLRKWAKSCGLKPNKKEKQLFGFVDMIFPNDYKLNVRANVMTLGGKIPDIVNVNGKKQVIEMLGTYWHSEKVTGRTKEQEEDFLKSHYSKYGYNCLIIWESELKNPDKLTQKIQNF